MVSLLLIPPLCLLHPSPTGFLCWSLNFWSASCLAWSQTFFQPGANLPSISTWLTLSAPSSLLMSDSSMSPPLTVLLHIAAPTSSPHLLSRFLLTCCVFPLLPSTYLHIFLYRVSHFFHLYHLLTISCTSMRIS